MPNELKPCPFCGGKAYVKQIGSGYGGGEFTADYEVGCSSCGIDFRGKSAFSVECGYPKIIQDGYKEAISKWNRRADNAE